MTIHFEKHYVPRGGILDPESNPFGMSLNFGFKRPSHEKTSLVQINDIMLGPNGTELYVSITA